VDEFTKENGKMISETGLGLRNTKMGIVTKENFTEGSRMVEGFLFGETGRYTKGMFIED